MPAIIRHWISASPVMFVGIVTATVTRPPRLVRNPCAAAKRTWFSITSWIALSTSPFCSASWASAACAAGGSGPTPAIARCSASRTKEEGSPGATWLSRGASCLPTTPAALLVTPTVESYGGAGRAHPLPVGLPGPARGGGRPGRCGRRPGARHAAGGVPPGDLPHARARRPATDALVLTGRPGDRAPRRPGRVPVPAPL